MASIKCTHCGSEKVEPLTTNLTDQWDTIFTESIDDAGGSHLFICKDCGFVFDTTKGVN